MQLAIIPIYFQPGELLCMVRFGLGPKVPGPKVPGADESYKCTSGHYNLEKIDRWPYL